MNNSYITHVEYNYY